MAVVFDWLAANEAFISAVVGTSSLLILALGLIKIVYRGASLPLNEGAPPMFSAVNPGTAGVTRFFMPIVNLGIEHHSHMEDRIASRTVNFATVCVMSIAVAMTAYGFSNPNGQPLAIINGLSFLICLFTFLFQVKGNLAVARWLLMMVVLFDWAGAQIFVGPWRGNEYVLAVVVALPVLVFKRSELKWRLLALLIIGLFAASVIGGGILFNIPHIDMPPGMHEIGYYLLLTIIVLAVFAVINFYVNFSVASFSEMEFEQGRTEELVKSIFPTEVLRHINADNQSVAESHEEATVIFITVGGFESLYQKISAVQLVELMSEIFVRFDELLVLHNVEKINTLGTHYVGASGIFNRQTPDHAAVARFALAALQAISGISDKLNHRFTLRAGISTGQVISGVIGSARPCFDIWGETVELANSIRDTAMDNSIVVNESAFWRLRDMFEFAEIPGQSESYLLLKSSWRG